MKRIFQSVVTGAIAAALLIIGANMANAKAADESTMKNKAVADAASTIAANDGITAVAQTSAQPADQAIGAQMKVTTKAQTKTASMAMADNHKTRAVHATGMSAAANNTIAKLHTARIDTAGYDPMARRLVLSC